ncbi:MAG: sigma-70 family RNA polymerase sigma factor [Dorea sp.]|jgi:RNA polymerase sigma factor (sigma-70 family)|nr:sigma-70 family RNA polymerase sigma factor [Dorea sp.]MCI9453898.1 sigma-70 family RNA polymerase sigma factor [Dorea sp.]
MRCDTKTFAQMYETVYQDLYRFALCMLRNPQDAEDAVSEAVVAAYENIGKLKKEDAFKSWIFTILSNICKKKWRNAAREETRSDEEMLFSAASEEPDIGVALDVRKAFFLLEDEEQTIVGLSVFGGYTSQEIGDALKLNPNTVRSKRSRALQKMECVLR